MPGSCTHNHAALRSAAAFAAVLVCALGGPAAAGADDGNCPPCATHVVGAESVVRAAAAGTPVFRVCARITGPLRLAPRSGVIRSAIVLQDSCIVSGGVDARSTEFRAVLDLAGTTIYGPADFYSAQFDRVAEFAGADFESRANFTDAAFHGDATMPSAIFAGKALFDSASFDHGVNFSLVELDGEASLQNAAFESLSRFTATKFFGNVSLAGARFDGGADFSAAVFGGAANFGLTTSDGDMGFQNAQFTGRRQNGASFARSLYSGKLDFTDAGAIPGDAVFDQAVIASLDLDGASVEWFGSPQRIDELRISPGAIARIKMTDDRPMREQEYRLLEDAARKADELSAANEAHVRRLTLERASRGAVWKQLDWALEWGVAGYFVRPSHPAVALAILFFAGVVVRGYLHRKSRRSAGAIVRGVFVDAGGAYRAFRKIKAQRPTLLLQVEITLYTVLLVVLVVNLEGVSPPIRNLVEGLL